VPRPAFYPSGIDRAEAQAAALELSIHNLEDDRSVICIVDRQLRLAYGNLAWDQFAGENGGAGLDRRSIEGKAILDFISPPVHDYYREVFRRAAESGQGWEHAYECSSPSHFRIFHMWIRPLRRSGGLLMVHSLRVKRPHGAQRPASEAVDAFYVLPERMVTMCCHCRRTLRLAGGGIWDWVPEYLNGAPAPVSHGMCPDCITYFYPELADWELGASGAAGGP
jgi:hypothetical protein